MNFSCFQDTRVILLFILKHLVSFFKCFYRVFFPALILRNRMFVGKNGRTTLKTEKYIGAVCVSFVFLLCYLICCLFFGDSNSCHYFEVFLTNEIWNLWRNSLRNGNIRAESIYILFLSFKSHITFIKTCPHAYVLHGVP